MLQIAGDAHTHTLYSRHAYSTIEENVRAAAEQGMELLGSMDHFSSMLHPFVDGEPDIRDYQFFINYRVWPSEWHGVRLMHGCEADIVDLEGHLYGWNYPLRKNITGYQLEYNRSLKEHVFASCDYVIASIHRYDFTHGASEAAITRMYVNALEDPKVLALGHIGRTGLNINLDEILLRTRELRKLVEINEHSLHGATVGVCRHIAERCAELGVQIMTSSDAHISCGIGRFDKLRTMLEEIDFPQELIATRSAEAFLNVWEKAIVLRG